MRFAWDEKKAASNLVKHGISFEEAESVFGDPFSDTFPDPDHSLEEHRFIITGSADSGKILVVAHTDDGVSTYHQRPRSNTWRKKVL